MERMAQVSSRVALIQHDNLLDVQNFIERNRIRMLEMEWVDGYDLDRCLRPMLERASARRPEAVGLHQQRDRHRRPEPPGSSRAWRSPSSVNAWRGLAALHREEIVHGDIKPSNIMIKRTGNAKIIDIGSAFDLNNMPQPENLHAAVRRSRSARSRRSHAAFDLASLGYVLIEMLAGRPLFAGIRDSDELLDKKRTLAAVAAQSAAAGSAYSELLMTICRRLTAPDPMLRYATAEQADTGSEDRRFQRTLVRGDLASEYENELRVWLEELDSQIHSRRAPPRS